MKISEDVDEQSAIPCTTTAAKPITSTATLGGLTPQGTPLVDVAGARYRGRSCVPLSSRDVGREIAIAFDIAHPDCPLVIGVVQPPSADAEVTVDARTVTFSACQSITLKCGEASITLNRDGKIVIRGVHLVSHASGVNRIRGGSVELN